jgi:hypothetical protein
MSETHFVAYKKKFLSQYNELLQFVAEKLIDCSSEYALLFEIPFIKNKGVVSGLRPLILSKKLPSKFYKKKLT